MQREQRREAVSSWRRPIRQILSKNRTRLNVSDTPSPSNPTSNLTPGTTPTIVDGHSVIARTVDGTDTVQKNALSDERTSESRSCWAQAYKKLEEKGPGLWITIQFSSEYDENDEPEKLLATLRRPERSPEPLPRWLEQSIRSVLQCKEVFSAAASLDPFKFAPIVVKGTLLILQASVDQPRLQQIVENNLNNVTSWITYWQNVESFYFNASAQNIDRRFENLKEKVVELYTKILYLFIEVQRITSRGKLAELALSQCLQEIWKPIYEEVAEKHGNCKEAFDLCKLHNEQYGKIKTWISEYKREKFHDDVLQKTQVRAKFPDCGQWFLESPEFEMWSPEKPVLWICGTTGTGKTTLIARLIEYYLNGTALPPDQRLVYIYCAKGQAYRSVLLALLRQAAFDPVTGKVFDQMQIAYQSSGGDSVDLRAFNFEALYEKVLGGILQSGIKLKILIDALNQCDDPDEVLTMIKNVSSKSPRNLELLFSSTRIDDVENVFDPIIVDTHTARSKMKADMKTFIERRVQNSKEYKRLLKGTSPDLENELIRILNERAGGMFRWVDLQLSFFLKSPQVRSEETIKGYLKRLDNKSVAGEKDLTEAYDAIFERNTDASDVERKCVTLIYQLMMCSQRPIDAKVAVAAVNSVKGKTSTVSANEERDLQSMRNMVRDFAMVTPVGTLDFAHHSVIEYLQRQHGAQYSATNPDANVALRCLDTLSSCPGDDYRARIEDDAFFRYCHQFWGYHCSKLSQQEQNELGVTAALQKWISNPTVLAADIRQCQRYQSPRWRTAINCERYQLPGNMDANPILACSIWKLEGLLTELMPVDCGHKINCSEGEDDRRSLAWAAACGHETIVDVLLRHGAEVNHREEPSSASALDLAASHGHATIVRKLIEHGAEITYEDDVTWEHPLHLAAMHGHAKVVGDLLEALASQGKDLNPLYRTMKQDFVSQTGFMSTAPPLDPWSDLYADLPTPHGHVSVGRIISSGHSLVSAGSPLSRASAYGQEDVVKVLLKHPGTQIDLRTESGETPLMLAAHGCHQGVMQVLLQKGADKDAQDNDGRTALMKAVESGFNLEAIKLLLGGPMVADIKDKRGHDAFYWARKHYIGHPGKNIPAIEYLLQEAGYGQHQLQQQQQIIPQPWSQSLPEFLSCFKPMCTR